MSVTVSSVNAKLPVYRRAETCHACGSKDHSLDYGTTGWVPDGKFLQMAVHFPHLNVTCKACGAWWVRSPRKKAA